MTEKNVTCVTNINKDTPYLLIALKPKQGIIEAKDCEGSLFTLETVLASKYGYSKGEGRYYGALINPSGHHLLLTQIKYSN